MKKILFAMCAASVLVGAYSVRASIPEYKYTFVPSSTSDGSSLASWSGGLFLDAPSSPAGGGSVADINQGLSYLDTPFGDFHLTDATLVEPRDPSGNPIAFPPIFWDSTMITGMAVEGVVSLDSKEYEWSITQTTIQMELLDPLTSTATGQWLANPGVRGVPDSTSTASLFALVVAGLCGFGYFKSNMAVRRSSL